MSTLNGILDGARRALYTHQLSLSITGHNIDNVNTPGFRRQRANLSASEPLNQRPGQLGTGVRVEEVVHTKTRFLDRQIANENALLGFAQERTRGMDVVESILLEPDEQGLSEVMDRFWNSWQDLSNEPDSLASRRVLLETADEVSDRFRLMARRFESARIDQDNRIPGYVQDINSAGEQLADLNKRIHDSLTRGSQPNDLIDRRDQLIDTLSTMGNLQIIEEDTGMVRVVLGNLPIVEGSHHQALEVRRVEDPAGTGLVNAVYWERTGFPLNLSSGELAASIEQRDHVLVSYQQDLDKYVAAFVSGLNALHRGGSDLESRAGLDFFNPDGITAATIELNLKPAQDENRIAASADGGIGNGDLALQISNLASNSLSALNGHSLDAVYGELVAGVGYDGQLARSELEVQSTFLGQLKEQRESITGVNLDEEMSNLLIQQQAYQAAGRVIAMVDEMMQTLIQLV